MSVDAATVRRIAHLARIAVEEGEVEHLQGELNAMLAFIEQRFLPKGSHLTRRDKNANRLQDMFDFNHSPSLNAVLSTAPAPVAGEHDCPFVSGGPHG